MSHWLGWIFLGVLLVALTLLPPPAAAQQPCENLAALKLPNTTITSATSEPAGPFALPGGSRAGTSVALPAFCRVAGVVTPEVKFEVWLPAGWNRKFLAAGNGGLAGSINYSAMADHLKRGYATASTDTGHTGSGDDGSWALGHFERVVDFGHRGVHVMTQAAKAIVAAFYGARPLHSYFSGCSQGGQEALMEAQRYPRDYDGVVAGDPANFWTHHYIGGHLWVVTVTQKDPASYIPANKVQLIAEAVNRACDALDGIEDGILNDPRRCHFDPATLLCQGADAPACLSAPQVEALRKLYAGARTAGGKQIYPGLEPGGESGPGGWATWITGSAPGKGLHFSLGMPFFKYIVFEDPDWDFRAFNFGSGADFDNDVDFTDGKVASISNATDPDLRPFRANGGKLIQYHGWSDPDITPLNSINYYKSAVSRTVSGSRSALHEAEDFYRLFMVPGMQHCTGGPGPYTFDALGALDEWVERGVAPDRIIATKYAEDNPSKGVAMTRPLCPYPHEAAWMGKGSTNDAANFVCRLPVRDSHGSSGSGPGRRHYRAPK